jgi:hypothetical protein
MEPFEAFYKSFPFFKSLAWLVFFKGILYVLKLLHANASQTWNKISKETHFFSSSVQGQAPCPLIPPLANIGRATACPVDP